MFRTNTRSTAKCERAQGASQKNMLAQYKQVGYYAGKVATILTVCYHHAVGQHKVSRHRGRIPTQPCPGRLQVKQQQQPAAESSCELPKKDALEFSGSIQCSKSCPLFLKIKSSHPYCAPVKRLSGW